MPPFDPNLPDTVHIRRYIERALLAEFLDSLGTVGRPTMWGGVDRLSEAEDTLKASAAMSTSNGHASRSWAMRWYFFAITDTGHRFVRYRDVRFCEYQINISC